MILQHSFEVTEQQKTLLTAEDYPKYIEANKRRGVSEMCNLMIGAIGWEQHDYNKNIYTTKAIIIKYAKYILFKNELKRILDEENIAPSAYIEIKKIFDLLEK